MYNQHGLAPTAKSHYGPALLFLVTSTIPLAAFLLQIGVG
jgi:hypothetical protein